MSVRVWGMAWLGYSTRAPVVVDHKQTVTVPQLVSTLRSCDLLFFSGWKWTSVLTRIITQSEFSHVAFVDCDSASGYRFLWESVLHAEDDLLDIFTKSSSKAGVRLVEAATAIDRYGRRNKTQEFRVGVLRFYVDATMTPEANQKLHATIAERLLQFQDQNHPKVFEQSPMNLVRAGFKDILGANPVLPSREYFCSNLVVSTYQHIGLLDKKYNSNEATPGSLAYHADKLPMEKGFRLGPELEIYTVRLDPPLGTPVPPPQQ